MIRTRLVLQQSVSSRRVSSSISTRAREYFRSSISGIRTGTWSNGSNKRLLSTQTQASTTTESHDDHNNDRGNNHDNNSNIKNDSQPQKYTNAKFPVQSDFFDEPVTFVSRDDTLASTTTTTTPYEHERNKLFVINTMAATDAQLLSVVSRGLSCIGGGKEAGFEMQPAHAAAITLTQALKFASATVNNRTAFAVMPTIVSVVPILIQGSGLPYLCHIDKLLKHCPPPAPGMDKISLVKMLQKVADIVPTSQGEKSNDKSKKSSVYDRLSDREQYHVRAVYYLMNGQPRLALVQYLRLLRYCPGDALGLVFAIDLAHALGDTNAALQASTAVSAYWHERRGGVIFRPSMPGHDMVSALVAVGLAVANYQFDHAEPLAMRTQTHKVAGANATWALAYIMATQGRTSEGISHLANFDGITNYENAGFLFFNTRLTGYGAHFALDREERGRGKSRALALYDFYYSRVFDYSGYSQGQAWTQPQQRAPISWIKNPAIADGQTKHDSWWNRIFGPKDGKDKKDDSGPRDADLVVREKGWVGKLGNQTPSSDDVLTWLPPTPILVSNATLLLLRFVFNGTITTKDVRWKCVQESWSVVLDMHRQHDERSLAVYSPMVAIAASLLYPPSETGADYVYGGTHLSKGLYKLGTLLKLNDGSGAFTTSVYTEDREKDASAIEVRKQAIAEAQPDFWYPSGDEKDGENWRLVVAYLQSALDGAPADALVKEDESVIYTGDNEHDFERFDHWNFECRPVIEHAVVYSACKSGDFKSLSLARSICSKGVTLRPNSPEEWWRYSIVLGLIGDQVASENALNMSINTGGGQGSRSYK